MKKEFGKWLMDIAKYMVTALLLSTIFADMEEPIIVYMVVILSIVVLIIGLILVDDNNQGYKKRKERSNEYTYRFGLNGTFGHHRAYLFQVSGPALCFSVRIALAGLRQTEPKA